MKYKILCNGKVIATFKYAPERDICLDALQEAFEDAVFTKEDSE